MNNSKTDEQDDNNFRRFSIVSKERCSPLQWEEVAQCPHKVAVAHHILAEIGNSLYIHGGIKDKGSLTPTNDFYRVDLENFNFENITTDDSPSLSQHACVTFTNRYLIIIGGWNGHCRINSVFIFDTQMSKWLKSPKVSGFPEKAGLSGHTVNPSIKTKGLFPDIIVIGREGSTKTQRRYGNGYRLCCNSDLSEFTYCELPLNFDSRSYHCTCVVNNKLFIVGGRDDKVIDIHKYKGLISTSICNTVSNLIERFHEFNLTPCPLIGRRKAARRGHCLIPGKNGFVVLGGSSFINTNQMADCAGFLFTDISAKDSDYYFLGYLKISRTDGAHCVSNSGHAYYHGGIGVDGKMQSHLLILKLNE